MGFEWDPAKAEANLAKHGVDFERAKLVFADPQMVKIDVTRIDLPEERHLAIGEIDGKLYTVVYVRRANNLRLISARRSHRSERRHYPGAIDPE